MSLLDLYIGRTILQQALLVMAVLVGLFTFVIFMDVFINSTNVISMCHHLPQISYYETGGFVTVNVRVFVTPDSLPKIVTFVFLVTVTSFGTISKACPALTVVVEKLATELTVVFGTI